MSANRVINHSDVVIADSNTEATGSVDTNGYLVAGIIVPSEFDGTAITFKACDTDDGTFLDVYNSDGTQFSVTTAASRHQALDPRDFAGVRFLKLVAGTAQTGATTLKLVMHQGS